MHPELPPPVPCFRSREFIRFLLVIAVIGVLPVVLELASVLVHTLTGTSAHVGVKPAWFQSLGLLSDVAWAAVPAGYFFIGLLVYFSPTLTRRERLALAYVAIFFILGLMAQGFVFLAAFG